MLLLPHACLCIRILLACSPVLSLSVAALPAVAVRPCLCLLRSLSCIGWTLNIPVLHRMASHAVLHRVDVRYPRLSSHRTQSCIGWTLNIPLLLGTCCVGLTSWKATCTTRAGPAKSWHLAHFVRFSRLWLGSLLPRRCRLGLLPAPLWHLGGPRESRLLGRLRTALAEEGGVIRGMPAALRADASIHLRPAFHAGAQWMGISPHVVASACMFVHPHLACLLARHLSIG